MRKEKEAQKNSKKHFKELVFFVYFMIPRTIIIYKYFHWHHFIVYKTIYICLFKKK